MRDLVFNIMARDGTRTAFNSAEERAKRFNNQVDKTTLGMRAAGLAASTFAAAFSITAITSFANMMRGVVKDAADLVDLSNKVGVNTDDLQKMQFGFEQAGVEAADLNQNLGQWSKRIGEAYTQGGRLAEIFKANGISLTDSEGRLRSSVDLMRDYADLVAGAGSDQERMTLATEAFGRSGGTMVLALRDGKAGMDKLMQAAEEAGGVLDEKLLQEAARLDDEFNALWHNFEVNSKTAILNTVGYLEKLYGVYKLIGMMSPTQKMLPQNDPAAAAAAQVVKGGMLPSPVDQRIDAAFALTKTDPESELARVLRDRYGKRTIIPGGEDDAGSRKASTAAAKEQVSAYDQVMKKLDEEAAAIGLNATEQKIMAEQRKANVTASSEEGRAIAAKINWIDRENAAYDSLTQKVDFLKSTTAGYFTEFRTGMQEGEGLLGSLGGAFSSFIDTTAAKAEEKFASSLIDKMIGSSGGAGLGILDFLFGSSARGFVPTTTLGGFLGHADGTDSSPGGWRLVGERGAELMKVSRGAQVLNSARTRGVLSGGQSSDAPVVVNFNVQTPDVAGFHRSESQIAARLRRVVAQGQRNN